MLLPNQRAIVHWHPGNKEYYVGKGYIFTKMKDPFEVKVEDLPMQSHAWVKVKCDFCGDVVDVKYQNYQNRGVLSDGYACTRCKHKKAKNSVQNRYNVDNVFQTDVYKDKSKETCLNKYGVEHYSQSQEAKDAIVQTCLSKYGVTSYLKTNECKNKIKQTNLSKYGYEWHTQSPEYTQWVKQILTERYGGIGMGSEITKRKILAVNKERYGYEHPTQSDVVQEKTHQTLFQNGTCATSKPQLELFDRLKEIYGNCELNYPCSRYSLDCMVIVNGIKIDVEYDGQYWHKNTGKRDYQRDWFVRNKGYKILRIKGNAKIPADEDIKEAINYLTMTDGCYTKITVDIKQKI